MTPEDQAADIAAIVRDDALWADAMAQATPQDPTVVGPTMYAALVAQGDPWFVQAAADGRIVEWTAPAWTSMDEVMAATLDALESLDDEDDEDDPVRASMEYDDPDPYANCTCVYCGGED